MYIWDYIVDCIWQGVQDIEACETLMHNKSLALVPHTHSQYLTGWMGHNMKMIRLKVSDGTAMLWRNPFQVFVWSSGTPQKFNQEDYMSILFRTDLCPGSNSHVCHCCPLPVISQQIRSSCFKQECNSAPTHSMYRSLVHSCLSCLHCNSSIPFTSRTKLHLSKEMESSRGEEFHP